MRNWRGTAAMRSAEAGVPRTMPAEPPFHLLINPRHGVPGIVVLPEGAFRRARAEIAGWPGRAPVAARSLDDWAKRLGIAALHVEEGGRDGDAASYGVLRLLVTELARRGVAAAAKAAELESGRFAEATRGITVVGAGDEALPVALAAARFGARCVVVLRPGYEGALRDAIAVSGAMIRTHASDEGDGLRHAAEVAAAEGWFIVSARSWTGQTELPRDMMQAQRLAAAETLDALPHPPSHVFVRAGAGGTKAAAFSVALRARHGIDSRLVVVEPAHASGLLVCAKHGGEPIGQPDDFAAATPDLLAWQELGRASFAFAALDEAAARGRGLPGGADLTLSALSVVAADSDARTRLGLRAGSRVLLAAD
ncbi:pyridoxal-phosphate dependent enzyme [Pseudoroseomonas globiformis]|uniref:Pyridoxal-phosphate dependent enzyme n=1 Tax=Teichococcus globiformis TaxID=2307229 RepID=A0ABV7G462_9PROT